MDGTCATGNGAFRRLRVPESNQPDTALHTTASASTSNEAVIDPHLLDLSYEGIRVTDNKPDLDSDGQMSYIF
jgi:hypothetical protein